MAKDMLDFLNESIDKKSSTGSIVKSFRKKFGLTQKELGKITGLSETHISAIEHDKIEIGKKRAEMLAAVFGIHPSTLLFPNGRWEMGKI
jgi:transcriptional regulator with XRE-family HTH domain